MNIEYELRDMHGYCKFFQCADGTFIVDPLFLQEFLSLTTQ